VVDLRVEQRNAKEGGYALDTPHSEEVPLAVVNTVERSISRRWREFIIS